MDGFYAELDVGRRCVDYMKQQHGVAQFFEGGVEGRYEFVGQVANETHGVRDDHLAFSGKAQASTHRIEGCEHLVFDEGVALGEAAQQGALARVGVADDR